MVTECDWQAARPRHAGNRPLSGYRAARDGASRSRCGVVDNLGRCGVPRGVLSDGEHLPQAWADARCGRGVRSDSGVAAGAGDRVERGATGARRATPQAAPLDAVLLHIVHFSGSRCGGGTRRVGDQPSQPRVQLLAADTKTAPAVAPAEASRREGTSA